MNRGTPLTRRTPLAAGTKGLSRGKGLNPGKGLAAGKGLTRSTGLAQGAELARQQPVQRPRKPRVAPEVRDAVLARSRGRCEVGVTTPCQARGRRLDSPEGTNQHHRNPGRMGGTKRAGANEAPNLLQVCGSGNTSGCHGWIENNRDAARDAGWLLRDGQDPAIEPVRLWDGRRVLLGHAEYRPLAGDGVALT